MKPKTNGAAKRRSTPPPSAPRTERVSPISSALAVLGRDAPDAHPFDPTCADCRPRIMHRASGQDLLPTDPVAVAALQVWELASREEQRAAHLAMLGERLSIEEFDLADRLRRRIEDVTGVRIGFDV